MSATNPNELDEDAQPNRWPFAIAISVFLHAIILLEVLITVWPETPGSTFRPAPLLPIAEKPRPTPGAAQKVAAIPAPEPERPIVAGPSDATAPPPDQVAPADPAPAAVPAAAPPPPRKHTALRQAQAAEPMPARARYPNLRATARRDDLTPAYASVGDWFRAMSRMRQGDFAPHRRH